MFGKSVKSHFPTYCFHSCGNTKILEDIKVAQYYSCLLCTSFHPCLCSFNHRYYRNLLKQGDLDESEMESLQQDKARYLNTSVECYLKYLNASSAELDIPVFRLCSLWFNNATDDKVNKLMKVCMGISLL